MRYVKFLLLALSLWLAGSSACYFLADGFHPAHVYTSDITPHSCPSPAPPVLKKSFYYLAKGSQCFCFESECGNYVLKLFRCNRYRIPSWLTPEALPSFLQEIYQRRREIKRQKWERFITSLEIAEGLKQQCALVYTHLEKTADLSPLLIYDKIDKAHLIDPNELLFVIQKKAETVASAAEHGSPKKIIDSVAKLIECRYQMGVGDEDAVIGKNMGICEGAPFFLDIGSFYYDERLKSPAHYQPELQKILSNYTSTR